MTITETYFVEQSPLGGRVSLYDPVQKISREFTPSELFETKTFNMGKLVIHDKPNFARILLADQLTAVGLVLFTVLFAIACFKLSTRE